LVDEEYTPDNEYNRNDWEDEYNQMYSSPLSTQTTARKTGRTDEPPAEQKSEPPKPSAIKTKKESRSCQETKSPFTIKSSKPLPTLKQSTSQTAPRQQLSQIRLPLVTSQIQEKDVIPIYGEISEENPYLIKSRPSENIMTLAHKIMSACSQVTEENTIQWDDSDSPSGVKISQLRNFSDSGIQVLSRYSSVVRMQQQYKETNGLAEL